MDAPGDTPCAVASTASGSAASDTLGLCSYRFIHPLSDKFAHIIEGDSELTVKAFRVRHRDQPNIVRFLVAFQCYHSAQIGLNGGSSFSGLR